MTSSDTPDTGPKKTIGEIVWRDLTVPNATKIRDFYADVVGWEVVNHPMPGAEGEDDYVDYVMHTPDGSGEGVAVGGICHARGSNVGLPASWLVYVRVANLDASVARASAKGGALVYGPRKMGTGRLAVVRDPAGAVLGLWAD